MSTTPSLTSHNSNSSSSFSSSSSAAAIAVSKTTTTTTTSITEESSIEDTKKSSLTNNLIKETNTIQSLILTPKTTITSLSAEINNFNKNNEFHKTHHDQQQQQQHELNDFNKTFEKNLLNYQSTNDINDSKLITTNNNNNNNKIINKKRRNCSNLFDIITDNEINIKNDRNLIKNIKTKEENIININNLQNNNNNTDNIDQHKLLEINSNKKFIINKNNNNNNSIDNNNKNIQSTSSFNNNYNSPNSNSCNSNISTNSNNSNINNNSFTNSNSNSSNSNNSNISSSSSSSGSSILAQINASSATISSGLSSSTTTTLSPFSGCNSNIIVANNNNNNLINNKQQHQKQVNICSLFNIADHNKQDNEINLNFNLNNNNNNSKGIRNITNTKINNDTIITEQMNIKEESTGNLLESGKAQIKIEDEPPPSQSPICHTPIMSDINIKKELKNISSPSSSSSSSNGNNGNGVGNIISGNSNDGLKNNNIIGSTNTGSTLHSSGGGGGGNGSGIVTNSSCSINSSTDNKKSDGNSTDDMLSSKDDILSDNNSDMNITVKKEEPIPDLSTDNFSPLCTSLNIGGNNNNGNGNNVNIQPILNTGPGQSGINGNGSSIVNPTSTSSSICSSNNNNNNNSSSNSTCGISSNSRGGKRMGISPPECGSIQSLTTSNSMNISGSGSGNGNNIGGGGGSGGNNGNGGNNNNNNKQSMGNNGGLGSVDYMQQQNHIFVFSTQLANKGAESVLNGQYPTIIAYHCAQPTTKKFLEDFFLKNPMKLSKMNRQNSINSQWIQQTQNLNNNNSHKLIQNKQSNNNNISSINSNNNNNNRISSTIKSSNSTSSSSSSTLTSNLQSTNSGSSFVNDELTGNDTDILSWEQNPNHLGLDNLQNGSNLDSMDDDGGNGIVSRESPTQNVTNSTSNNNNNNNRNQMQSSTTTSIHQQQSPTMLTSNSLTGPTSPTLSCLQPSLQGVKVPDENLTPQQRQHREEQLAKLKKMNQFLFPEHTSGIGPDFISAISTDNSTEQSLIGTNSIVGNVITPSNSKLISGPSGIVNQSNNNSTVNVPVGMISGTSGGVSNVIGPNNTGSGVSGPNNIPIIPNLSGSGNGTIPGAMVTSLGPQNNRGGNNNTSNNNMISVNSGGLGSRNIASMCRQIGSLNNIPDNMSNNLNDFGIMMGNSNHNGQQNQQSIMNSIMSGGGGPMSSQLNSMGPGNINQCGPLGGNSNMMIGSGQKNIMGGIAQMEWNKLQHQYYEERTKGGKPSIDSIAIGELCTSSQNMPGVIGPNGRQIIPHSNNNNNNLPPSCTGSGPIRQNSQNCQRSQGPPPPYHHTPRSASVPIATQSPNPGSPNNPTSNLSLPSPRTGGSTLNSPAGDVTTSSNNNSTGAQQQCNKSQQIQYKQDSPSGGNNGNGNSGTNNNRTALSHSSNPNTPISSHMSPNASLKDLELGNTSLANNNQDICDNNLMPAPSPEQVQNLNIFEEELTIQKHINRQNSFTFPLSPQTPNFEKNRMNTSGPSPQGPRTPSMTGEHSNPSSIDSRFPSASPNINFSPVTGQNNQNQSGSSGNVQQQQIGTGSNNNQQKLQNFMDSGPGGLNSSGKCSTSVNETTTSNFTLRTDNLPLNPHTNCPPPAKPSHFDPISSLAQMSQQLTNSVSNSINGGHPNNPGIMGGFPNHGGMGMSPGDMSIGSHGPGPDNLMGPGGMDPCGMAAMGISGMGGGGGNIGGPPGVLPGGQYVMHGVPQGNMSAFGPMSGIPPRSLSPKLTGAGGIMAFSGNGPPVGMQAHRMMGRPMIGPGSGNPYNGANIQVKASTPNTIQYLPARPQIGNNNPRAPPSLEFLQRFANPIPGMDNCQPNKISGGGIGPSGGGQNMQSFYTNCNQIGPNSMGGGSNMNIPHGLDSSGLGGPDSNNSMINMNMIGPGINAGNSMCGPMGQNIMMRGLRPPGQGGGSGMLRMPVGQNMTGSPGIGHHHHHHHHHHSFNNGPQNNTQQNDPSMFSNQMFGGGSGGPKVNTLNMLGGPNSGGGSQIPGAGGNIMQSESGQSLPSSLSGPGQSGGGNNGSGNTGVGGNGPNSGAPNNFKSQFVGPSTADPNYAQQYHNFQQQLYATSTRSQPGGPGGNTGIPGGPSSSNQSFFVPK